MELQEIINIKSKDKVNSTIVLSTYLGNRCKYPMDVSATLYVLYDALNHYLSFDFGIPCDIVLVNHDVTTLYNFDKIISEETRKLIYKGKELFSEFEGKELFNGGTIKLLNRDWNNGCGMAMASFSYAFNQFRDKYEYWFFNEDDVKIMKKGYFKELIDILNIDDKIALASSWRDSPLGVSSTFYLDKMYNKYGKLLGTYDELSKESQIKSIEKQEYFSWDDGDMGSKRRIEGSDGQNGWNKFFNNIGYRIEKNEDEFHHNCVLYPRLSHVLNKHQTPRIIISEEDELIIIRSSISKEIINIVPIALRSMLECHVEREKIDKWIK